LLLEGRRVARIGDAPGAERRAMVQAGKARRTEETVLVLEIGAGARARPPRDRPAVNAAALRLLQHVVVFLFSAAHGQPPSRVRLPVKACPVEARSVVAAVDEAVVVADVGMVVFQRRAEEAHRACDVPRPLLGAELAESGGGAVGPDIRIAQLVLQIGSLVSDIR